MVTVFAKSILVQRSGICYNDVVPLVASNVHESFHVEAAIPVLRVAVVPRDRGMRDTERA